jgi:dihydrofolate reductase
MMRLKAIAAVSLNGVIGRDGKIPWHYPQELQFFKKTTMGGALLMGRKTFESIGKPLPGRTSLVLTRDLQSANRLDHSAVHFLNDVADLKKINLNCPIWVCGGADVYQQLLPYCETLYLTTIKHIVEGDTFFPEFKSFFTLQEELQDTPDYSISIYCSTLSGR